MRLTIKLFARLKEIVGSGDLVRDVEAPATVGQVWNQLVKEFPGLTDYTRSISAAINTEYVPQTAAVRDGDEVAFLPPVSGGATGSWSLQPVG